MAFLCALGLIFLIPAVQFKSVTQPLVVMAASPMVFLLALLVGLWYRMEAYKLIFISKLG